MPYIEPNMQKYLTIILLTICLTTYGQQGMWKPFKLVVIQPDTAVIDHSFDSDKDSVEAIQLKRYYKSVNLIDKMLDCIGCPRDSIQTQKMKAELVRLKAREGEAKKFKFYQLLSSYSCEVYNFYFNEYKPYSTIFQMPSQKTDLASLKVLADATKADYIVFYENIHTQQKDGMPILKLTTSLYSRTDKKIILIKET
jgi:hypothetical protein